MFLVNYTDEAWIHSFITEVLTEEDFFDIVNSDDARLMIATKLGYKKISDTYVYLNQNGEIEEDHNLRKLINNIENNEMYNVRFVKTLKKIINN